MVAIGSCEPPLPFLKGEGKRGIAEQIPKATLLCYAEIVLARHRG